MANDVSDKALQAVVAALVETGRVPASWADLADDPEALVNTIRSAGTVGVIDLSKVVLWDSPVNSEVIRSNEDAARISLALIEPKETHLAVVTRGEGRYYVAVVKDESFGEALGALTGGPRQVENIEAAAADWTDDGGYSLESGRE